jgi:uncharacterized protein
LSYFANINDHGRTPLMMAAFGNHTEVVKLLIEAGADMEAKNRDGDTALIWALYSGKAEASQLLIDAGADVNVRNQMGKTAFDYAEKLGRPDIIACMKTATPRNIGRAIENGVQKPLVIRKPLRLRPK